MAGITFILFIVSLFLAFCVATVWHEYGHYRQALRYGVTPTEFAIGMGPAIFSRKNSAGTKFSVRIAPLGGYCAFPDDGIEALPDSKRASILFAGCKNNLIMAVIVGFGFGIIRALLIGETVKDGIMYIVDLFGSIILTMTMLFTDTTEVLFPEQSSGEMIADFSTKVTPTIGLFIALFFLSVVFFNGFLGLFNLLPVPGLDGGQIVLLGIRAVLRKFGLDISEYKMAKLNQLGMAVIITLCGVPFVVDLIRSAMVDISSLM